MADGFTEAFVKWPTGVYLLWYPAKSRRATDGLAQRVGRNRRHNCRRWKMPAAGVQRRAADSGRGAALASAGVLVVNPPWTLADELKAILPELEKPLGQGGAGRFQARPRPGPAWPLKKP